MINHDEAPQDLTTRTRQFALRIIRLFGNLKPQDVAGQVIGKQLLRSGTSVGAQYCEASRARSRAEFVSKLESSLQELEETRYWLALLAEAEIVPEARLLPLQTEARELTAIFVASARTAKSSIEKRRPRKLP